MARNPRVKGLRDVVEHQKPAVPSPQAPPAMPPPTAEEIAAERQITARLQNLAAELHQRNLDAAVQLAQQAARHRGPLVDWFAEIGRRFGDTLDVQPQKPVLRLVKGEA